MRIHPSEYWARSLRVHEFLHDVPLEDVWAIKLPGGGLGRTVEDLRELSIASVKTASRTVQGLFRLRSRIGAWFGWDRRRPEWDGESFAARLSAADRARSTVPAGTPDGRLRLLYRFADEQLSEVRNGTVHAFWSLSLRPAPHGYLAYLAVYVRPVRWFTHLYMGAIAPFRRLVVYPALVRGVQGAWAKRYSGG
jgi:hypothetical protein